MKMPNVVLIPPRCTTDQALGHWSDFRVLAAISVVGPLVVPNLASSEFSGAVAIYCVIALVVGAFWATVASWRSYPNPPQGPQPPARLAFTARWMAHMTNRLRVVRQSLRVRGAMRSGEETGV